MQIVKDETSMVNKLLLDSQLPQKLEKMLIKTRMMSRWTNSQSLKVLIVSQVME